MQHDAPSREIIIGIDTHKDTHVAVALNALGVRLGATIVPINRVGYRCIDAWARSFGTVTAVGIEGTGSYGLVLPAPCARQGIMSWRSIAPTEAPAVGTARPT